MRKHPAPASVFALLLLFCVWPAPGLAQTAFERWYGGSDREEGQSVVQTSDGGYILCGYTKSFGDPDGDVYVVKTDANGDTLWTKTFGGTSFEESFRVQQTRDGGYIIAGQTASFGNLFQMYLLKIRASGDLHWQRTYGGSLVEKGKSAQQTADGGYIILGETNGFGGGGYDMYLVKTDSLGIQEWQHAYGGAGYERGHSVEQTSDGGYILAGYTDSWGAGGVDVYLVRTNADGDTLWTRTYGGPGQDLPHYGRCVRQTLDGGFVVAGYTTSFGAGSYDVYLVKTDAAGDSEWQRTYGGSQLECGRSVQQTSDGGYVIAASTASYGAGLNDAYLIKTDADGDTLWTRTFGGTNYDYAESVEETADGGYIVGGYTKSFGAGEFDFYLIKVAPETSGIDELPAGGVISFARSGPNPSRGATVITYGLSRSSGVDMGIYDVLGHRVRTLVDKNEEAGVRTLFWNGRDDSGRRVDSGIYFCRVRADGHSAVTTLCLTR